MSGNYGSYAEAKARKPVRWWHEYIIDDMLANPRSTMPERAARLKYSESYLSLLMNTDMFKALYETRRAEFNARLDHAIQNKTQLVANKALDLVLETLETKRLSIPFPALADFTDRTLERLGYGLKPNGTQVNVQVNTQPSITKEQLADARRDLRAIEDQRERALPSEPTTSLPLGGKGSA